MQRRQLLQGAAAATLLSSASSAWASWPERPLTIVVPWAPGGSTDILARALGEQIARSIGQPVLVENRPGASGNVGTAAVARAKPDGHTILFGSMSTHTMNPAMMSTMPFKGTDLAGIGVLAYVTNTMVIHPSVPAGNLREFIAYARANPGKVAYASAGPGSTNHLSAAMFERFAKVEMLHVPYKGGAPAVADTVGGQVQVFFTAGTQSLPHVRAGRLKLLAVTESRRAALLPEIPTVAETLPGYELAVWYGAFAPAGTPRELINRWNAEIGKALAQPEIKARFDAMGIEAAQSTPAQFDALVQADEQRYGKLIRELNIKAD